MQVQVGSTQAANLSTDILVFGVQGSGGRRSPAWKALNAVLGGGLNSLLKIQGWKGKAGEMASFPAPRGSRARLLVLGSLGEKGDSTAAIRSLAIKVGGLVAKSGLERAAFYLDPAMGSNQALDRTAAQAIGEGLVWGAYRFDRHQSKAESHGTPTSTYLYFEGRKQRPALAEAIRQGGIIGEAQNMSRDLVNEPGNIINPETLTDFARQLAADEGLGIEVLDEDECMKRGMGAFLAVGQGAETKSALVHLSYVPSGRARRRVALVGKAVTFDAGGLCLKTAAGQATMKMDMGGSAAVIGAIRAAAQLKIDTEVHAIFAATENLLGAAAYRTGDVIKASNGKTIEVLNTDAEGRLTLADALHFACGLEPDAIIDLATLTGACVVALGPSVAGIMGSGRGLIRDLRAAGDRAGEVLWELPMPNEYRELIQSKVADVQNIGGRWGGAITAGMFLREFVDESIPWAHIDIAGPCYIEKPIGGKPVGATGFPVRGLVEWLQHS
ncbi:MAG TPA: leucyl aminopeptidase [Deltaproteobacteria bacterium]|nr:leucyl aminopeptidase [Deltaproteobacteria bacterium]HCP48069.1 leucyl aminopeptidase [Deltaproteobacteria bacterium]